MYGNKEIEREFWVKNFYGLNIDFSSVEKDYEFFIKFQSNWKKLQ